MCSKDFHEVLDTDICFLELHVVATFSLSQDPFPDLPDLPPWFDGSLRRG